MKLRDFLLIGFVGAPLWAACSSSKTEQASSPAGKGPDARPSIGAYPGEPYGNTVGETLANFKLQGYVNEDANVISNTTPFVDAYSLEDIRATGASYALVHVSEFF
jgi:hypothetical protein